MAHLFESGFFGNNAPAWHKLGKVVTGTLTSEEALIEAGLDWTVSLADLWYDIGEGKRGRVQDQFGVIRSSDQKCLGVVGNLYHTVQNQECFAFLDNIIGKHHCRYDTAGSLDGGKKVWMLVQLPTVLTATREDKTIPYLLLSTTHDGSGCLRILLTGVRVVCNNTLTLALSKGTREGIFIKHTKGAIKEFTEKAIKSIDEVIASLGLQQEKITQLVETRITEHQAKDYFKDVFRIKQDEKLLESIVTLQQTATEEQAGIMGDLLRGYKEQTKHKATRDAKLLDTMLDIYHNERNTLTGIEGTAWAAYNAVTEYLDHEKQSRGRDNVERLNNKMESALFGQDMILKAEAMEKALAL